MLVAGVALLIGRVIYLARQGGTQAASAAATSVEPATLLAQARLVVPTGAEIKSISLSGAHLAVQHQGPGVELGIVVLDLSTGQIISRISIDRGK